MHWAGLSVVATSLMLLLHSICFLAMERGQAQSEVPNDDLGWSQDVKMYCAKLNTTTDNDHASEELCQELVREIGYAVAAGLGQSDPSIIRTLFKRISEQHLAVSGTEDLAANSETQSQSPAGVAVTTAPNMLTTEANSVEMHFEPPPISGDNGGFNVKNASIKDVKGGYIGHRRVDLDGEVWQLPTGNMEPQSDPDFNMSVNLDEGGYLRRTRRDASSSVSCPEMKPETTGFVLMSGAGSLSLAAVLTYLILPNTKVVHVPLSHLLLSGALSLNVFASEKTYSAGAATLLLLHALCVSTFWRLVKKREQEDILLGSSSAGSSSFYLPGELDEIDSGVFL